MESGITHQVKQLYEVEKLSQRQIATKLGVSRKKVLRILQGEEVRKPARETIFKPYERLVQEWYREHPFLRVTQVYERLKGYGYSGGYDTVKIHTQSLRKKKSGWFHELEFLPGEEAQVDWMEWRFPFGILYGFVLILAYSRYLYVHFYPRHSLEFFLDGHLRAFGEMGGVAHRHRYDNLRSVVLSRTPELTFNPKFLDFVRHYGFSVHPCTPGRPNEKGRVERVIRDIKDFLRVTSYQDLVEVNLKVSAWRQERNQRVHRSTEKRPIDLLKEEKLKPLPQIPYSPHQVILTQTTKTGFVEFDTNRYSIPSSFSGASCELLSYPDQVEIWVKGRRVALHPRSFARKQKIEHPTHREKLLQITPHFKTKRIYQLMNRMDKSVSSFLQEAEAEGQSPMEVAHELFKLLTQNSKTMFLSAIREANSLKLYKVKYLQSLLQPSPSRLDQPVHPQNPQLLTITYSGRSLKDYDDLI
jgi:transposase